MRAWLVATALAVATLGACGRGQPAAETGETIAPAPPLAMARVRPRNAAVPIRVTSEALGPGGVIDLRHSAYGENRSLPLQWDAIAGAKAYAVIVEDSDSAGRPFVHWLIWNVPGEAAQLPEGVAAVDRPNGPAGPVQGRNDNGSLGYFGPRPPPGSGPHHYHFQVFALDEQLPVAAASDRGAVLTAMGGHVLADGELVAVFTAPR
jgi:Raf kinase inhibitor-like YbhB/YbcL family protein